MIMEKKALIFYVAVTLVGLGIMAGLVLYLRSRNAPNVIPVAIQSTTSTAAVQNLTGNQTNSKVRYAVPLDKIPKAESYKPGDPINEQLPTLTISPDGQLDQ